MHLTSILNLVFLMFIVLALCPTLRREGGLNNLQCWINSYIHSYKNQEYEIKMCPSLFNIPGS